jgi:hypothetical protein
MEPCSQVPAEAKQDPWEYILRKYVLMLATLVATVTYGLGFNPPGGVWQDSIGGHLAGEPIVRITNKLRYLVFFFCNAVALALSVVVICHFLILSVETVVKMNVRTRLKPLRVVMVLDLLSFMGAYAAGSCHDRFTTVYTSVLMAATVSTYLAVQMVLASRPECRWSSHDRQLEERLRKVLLLLATFVVSVTYVSGLSSPPGGFWDNAEAGHRPGDAILKDHYRARLVTFVVCNSTAFTASLLIIMLLLSRKLRERTVRSRQMFGCVVAALVGLVGAYAAGSCRETAANVYLVLMVAVACLLCILLQTCLQKDEDRYRVQIQIQDQQIINCY